MCTSFSNFITVTFCVYVRTCSSITNFGVANIIESIISVKVLDGNEVALWLYTLYIMDQTL